MGFADPISWLLFSRTELGEPVGGLAHVYKGGVKCVPR